MYRDERGTMLLVLVFSVAATVTSISILSISVTRIGVTGHPFPGMDACFDVSSDNLLWFTPLPVIPWEILACFLAVRKAQHHREMTRMAGQTSGSRILGILSRDSVIYFAAILAIDISMAVIWRTGPVRNFIDSTTSRLCKPILYSIFDVGEPPAF
ncbi:hypothetical protein EXIGLDRAFT_762460 [Exidia glandulosa HHB12029]|uniref:Uncharacterized protein n=1 Tax=Exidia glandulosa HHB12029 TaxID=1314781 RepID=A0A165MPV1_EXIGL|nr:hypothetical protein EXIGLDRAFT_762460 [Exidia glandulosa HHB12029]